MKKIVFTMVLLCSRLFAAEGFESGLPAAWKTDHGSLETTTRRAKAGEASLQWQWNKPEAALVWHMPAENVNPGDTFGFWLYSPGINNRLTVSFYGNGSLIGSVWYNLNFTGWRACGMPYSTLGIGKNQPVSEIRFTFEKRLSRGSLWFDEVTLKGAGGGLSADSIQPWVGDPSILKRPYSAASFSTADIARNRPWLPALVNESRIPAQDKADLDRVTQALAGAFTYARSPGYGSLQALRDEFAAFKLTESGGIIKGAPIAIGGFYPVPGSLSFAGRVIPMMEKLCTAYSREKDAAQRDVLAMYLLLCRHILDQGFQEGNSNTGWGGNGYDMRHYAPAIYRMAAPLRTAKLLDPMLKSTLWICEGSSLFSQSPETYCDGMYNYTVHLPQGIALIPDAAQRYQRFRALKRHYDLALTRIGRPFYPDGSIHHHAGHHLHYGSYSTPVLLRRQLLPFAGTVFAVSPEVNKRLLTVLEACYMQAVGGKLPPTVMLRSGVAGGINIEEIARCTALITGDAKAKAIFMDACANKNDPLYLQYQTEGITPRNTAGSKAINTAALLIHRRPGWQAVMAGLSTQFRGLEIYGWTETNNYDEFSRNGSILIDNSGDNGYLEAGWNHFCWPGTTTRHSDPIDLYRHCTMRGNSTRFNGGVDNSRDGVWGLHHRAGGITFKKSAFCFGDTITAITTGVEVPGNPLPLPIITTTLIQEGSAAEPRALAINGKPVEAYPFETTLFNFPATLRDGRGNGYFIHPGSAPLSITRNEQSWTYFFSRYLKDKTQNPNLNPHNRQKRDFREPVFADNAAYYTPTTAPYTLAAFSHTSDRPTPCAYTILPGTTPEALQAFAKAPSVKIIAQTDALHAVYHAPSKTTGYVVFDAQAAEFPEGFPLRSVSHAGFYLVEPTGKAPLVYYATSDETLTGQTLTLRLANREKPFTLTIPYLVSGVAKEKE